MLSSSHSEQIADYLNRELVQYIANESKSNRLMNGPQGRKRDSKLERMIKHTIMNVESMSDEYKYAVPGLNANRRKRGFSSVQSNGKFFEPIPLYPKNIGIRIPHHDEWKDQE